MRRSQKTLRAGRIRIASYLDMFGLPTNQIVHLSGLNDKTIREIKGEPSAFARDDPRFSSLFPCSPKAREESIKKNFGCSLVRQQSALLMLMHYLRNHDDIWDPDPLKMIGSLLVASLEWQRIYVGEEKIEPFLVSPSFALTLLKEMEYGRGELIKCGKCTMPVLTMQNLEKPRAVRFCGFCHQDPEPFRDVILSRHRPN